MANASAGIEVQFSRQGTALVAVSEEGEEGLRLLVRRQVCCTHPRVARIRAIDASRGMHVTLESTAVTTLGQLFEEGITLPFAAMVSLMTQMCAGVEALHARDGEALGVWSWDNILLGVHGDVLVLSCPPLGEAVRGPEVGEAVDPSTDVVVLSRMYTEALCRVELSEEVGDAMECVETRRAYEEAMDALERGCSPGVAGRFASVGELREALEQVWSVLGVAADREALGHVAQRYLFQRRPRVVQVGPDCVWVMPPCGAVVDLSERPMLRRLVWALVRAQGASVTADALIAATWPEERILKEAARNRLYAALSRLRSMGLRDVIAHNHAGYRLTLDVVESRSLERVL